MKPLLYPCLIVTLALQLAACDADQPTPDTGTLPAPGEWRLINYWAIWCKPCREEIPALNALHERPGVSVLGFNFDRKQGDELAQQIADLGIEFPQLDFDPGPLLSVPRPNGLPITVVVAPDGRVVDTLLGPQTEASLLAAIEVDSD